MKFLRLILKFSGEIGCPQVYGDVFEESRSYLVINRGENGELRVGVRRQARQQSSMLSSVISRQSMHLGVLETA